MFRSYSLSPETSLWRIKMKWKSSIGDLRLWKDRIRVGAQQLNNWLIVSRDHYHVINITHTERNTDTLNLTQSTDPPIQTSSNSGREDVCEYNNGDVHLKPVRNKTNFGFYLLDHYCPVRYHQCHIQSGSCCCSGSTCGVKTTKHTQTNSINEEKRSKPPWNMVDVTKTRLINYIYWFWENINIFKHLFVEKEHVQYIK